MISPEKLSRLRQQYTKQIGKALLKPNGPVTPTPRASLHFGKRLRDHTLNQFPILPGALQVYVDLASTREWTVSGPPRSVARSVEWINYAESINTHTGLVEYGYDAYLKRRVQDYVVVGMTTMASSPDLGDINPPLEYIDPTLLLFDRQMRHTRLANGFVKRVKPEEEVWLYDRSRRIKSKDLIYHHPYPLGSNGFVSPIMYLLPTATLAWLIRESDSAQIDGRKIRDIFLVADTKISDAIEQGVLTLLALWEGDSEEDVGIPIIPISGLPPGQKVSDTFARLGVSEIPATLSREEFIFTYVNEISAALGLSLRHFWNNEKTTNRALEVVQEQRQQQKGPSTFVRTEQRIMNRSGFLKRFGKGRETPRFGFVEETDMSAMQSRAVALKDLASALGGISTSLGMRIAPESLIAWMQIEGVLPNEIELIGTETEMSRTTSGDPNKKPGEITGESDPDTTSQPTDEPLSQASTEKALDYGEIVMSGEGAVLARRHKVYSVAKYLEQDVKKDLDVFSGNGVVEESDEAIEKWVAQTLYTHNTRLVKSLTETSFLDNWIQKNADTYDSGLLNDTIYNCLNNVSLTEEELKIIDTISFDWEVFNDSSELTSEH